ncbi:hypothetical protein HGG75_27685 [Ochrobactrum pseudogrignonense]|nr:hypothetical protein [Brucella pseudogrignonensis]
MAKRLARTTEAAYIYDAASGYVIAQIHESQEIIDLVWRPDGNAVAFSTADGFLKLYDIKSRKFAAVTRMGPVRIGALSHGFLTETRSQAASTRCVKSLCGIRKRLPSFAVWMG